MENSVGRRVNEIFSYGTCVVSIDADDDPSLQAKAILQQFGHSIPGTPSADMLVYELHDTGDFVIGGHHPNVLTFVSRDMLFSDISTDQLVTVAAFLGRDLRILDTFALNPLQTSVIEK